MPQTHNSDHRQNRRYVEIFSLPVKILKKKTKKNSEIYFKQSLSCCNRYSCFSFRKINFSCFRNRDTGYRSDHAFHDHDEREILSHSSSELSKSSNVDTASFGSTGPISLREKRKNNEYESPLSRVPNNTRWGQ